MQNWTTKTASFIDLLRHWSEEDVEAVWRDTTAADVVTAIHDPRPDPLNLLRLLSPAAGNHLEIMAQKSALLTRRRFGNTLQFYVPLYVSNYCRNYCRYCGFSCNNRVTRSALTIQEALQEADYLANEGFRHLLLVAGEDRENVPVDYFAELATELQNRFASISVEIYPLLQNEYSRLIEAGVDGLTLYQETYDPSTYVTMHPAGPKKDFIRRLQAIENGGEAGMRNLGIGALLGLADWRLEAFSLGLHALYLQNRYWQSQVAISFPRLRKAPGGINPPLPVSDRDLVQMLCALRLVLPNAEMVLSTRESAFLRDNLIPLGITRISAASKTSPGGYTLEKNKKKTEAGDQFEVQDNRSLKTMLEAVKAQGFEPVLKNWDQSLISV